MQKITLADLPPHLLIPEPQLLSEATLEVYHPNISREFCHLLTPRVLHPDNIRVQVPHKYGVYSREVIGHLLEVWEVIQVSQGDVIFNKGCPMQSIDYFSDLHVWSVGARRINVPYLRSLPHKHYYPPPL